MKPNDIIRNFKVLYRQELPEINAVLWRMEHVKNGADLVWLQRDDENKTFCIGFKTIPQDHTGVFHILEHSVLNGSRKYPVKEPFVELIKSSMSTFLNAMTYPDKTVYPVSSRNPKDFLNLMDVYLDAVINPLSVEDPHAFRQEGWHYEIDSPEGELSCNGVVYNEMKGAFASNDEVLNYEMGLALFPDNCYKYVSGGHPEHIPELSYENYLASHHRFYHPSNARIVLDGDLDIDAALEKIDSYIGGYDRLDVDADIPMQKPVAPAERIAEYEIGAEEDGKNKAIIAKGWVYNDFRDDEKTLGFYILADALCETNDSPLTKAVLDSGLAEDVSLYNYDGVQQTAANLVIKNCDPEKREEIWKIVEDKLKELAEKGLDRKLLSGILSRREFAAREKDYGNMPKGLVYALTTYESWLYGGDPAQNLQINKKIASLRKKIDEGWFENLIKEIFLDGKHRAKVCLLPSKTLGEEKRKKEAERCAKIKASWSDKEIETAIEQFKALRKRQETPDSPEQIDMLPKLRLSDIPDEMKICKQDVYDAAGIKVLSQPLATDGITYLNLYFSMKDFTVSELKEASVLSKLLSDIPTENYSVTELSAELQRCLGRFGTDTAVYGRAGATAAANPLFTVKISFLDSSKDDAVRLADEILNRSVFDDTAFIYNIIRQLRIGMEQGISMRGNSFAIKRALSAFSSKNAALEAMGGITMLRYLQKTDAEFSEKGAEICASLKKLCGKIFSRSRLTVSMTGKYDEKLAERICGICGNAPEGGDAEYAPCEKVREGFSIPAQIGFAGLAGNLADAGTEYNASSKVAAQLLTYDYLWNAVRVKGGAYGVSFNVSSDGDVYFSSYRDPNPSGALGCFRDSVNVLRSFCESGESVEKYIISTLSNIDPLNTPRIDGELAARRWFCGITDDMLRKERAEILGTGKKELSEFADVLEKVLASAGTCVVGGKDTLESCGLDRTEAVQ